MHTPWHNKTGLAKAIAILASIAILAFGLCAADLVGNVPSDNKWLTPLQYLPGLCSIVVVGSLLALVILLDIDRRRSRRANRRDES